MRVPPHLLLLLATPACIEFGPPRDDFPGALLGDYAVTGQLLSSTCGEGALGSPESWSFAVRLTRQGDELFWGNGREFILGSVEGDTERFTLASELAVEIEPPRPSAPGCTVWRRDAITGEFTGLAGEASGFEGDLAYDFTAAEGADCSGFVGSPDGLVALPCQMRYALVAERVDPAVTPQ